MVYFTSLVNYLVDITALLLLIRPSDESERRTRDMLGGVLFLLALFLLYLPPNVINIERIRFPLYILLASAVSILLGRRVLGASVYLAVIYTDILNATRILFPLIMWAARRLLPGDTVVALSQVLLLSTAPIRFGILYLVSRTIPVRKLGKIRALQWGTLILLSVLIAFSKDVANDTIKHSAVEFSTLFYPVLIIVLSVAILALFDNLLISQRERRQESLMTLNLEYQLKSLETRNLASEEVHHLYHDMKNHLLLLERNSAENQKEYIRDLWQRLDNAQSEVNTGSETLNGLLEEYLVKARTAGICMSIDADFSGLENVSPVDLCAIFGNALDNAFEAAGKVPAEERPFIRVKTSRFANQLAVRISNSYINPLTSDEQTSLLRTTKEDAASHGIGMSSMQSAVTRCGGSISYKATPEEGFSLFILLPLAGSGEE